MDPFHLQSGHDLDCGARGTFPFRGRSVLWSATALCQIPRSPLWERHLQSHLGGEPTMPTSRELPDPHLPNRSGRSATSRTPSAATTREPRRPWHWSRGCGENFGAGDGNRTRTTSLEGIKSSDICLAKPSYHAVEVDFFNPPVSAGVKQLHLLIARLLHDTSKAYPLATPHLYTPCTRCQGSDSPPWIV